MKELLDTDWAYLAGFIDGEGCIGSSRSRDRWYPRLTITQADQMFLLELYKLFGVGRFTYRKPTVKNKATGFSGQWSIRSSPSIKWILEGVLPYLRLKKTQAEVALRLLENRDEEDLVLELSALKEPKRPVGLKRQEFLATQKVGD
jgi:hypothetical protein